MPVDRQRGSKSKKCKKDGLTVQLTWTTPVEAETTSTTSTAVLLSSLDVSESKFVAETPTTFEPPQEPALFPPHEEYDPDASPSKAAHAKKKGEDHIPRPPNAFILFRSSFIKSNHISSGVEGDHSTLSKIIGITWQNMPDEERKFWHGKAKAAQEDHKRRFPDYAFRPLHPRGQPIQPKRRVREVAPKDMSRCARIAELLVEGKKGSELEQAMAEFDKNNVKPIVARFEEPLTARQFRKRSCSQPPELEASTSSRAARFMSSSPKASKRQVRATSSQPSAKASKRKARTSPSTPAPATPAPSTPAPAAMPDIAEEPYNEIPPLVLPPGADPDSAFPSFSAGDLQSFDFTFAFNEGHAAQIDTCDPLAPVPRPTSGSSVDSHTQTTATPSFPSLTIDTSFYDSWSAPSSSPTPCTPSTCSPDQPPPFYAISPVSAAPDYGFSGYSPVPDPYGAQSFPPAPPYAETSPYPMSIGSFELPKEDHSFYAHKFPTDPVLDSQLYHQMSAELFPYSL